MSDISTETLQAWSDAWARHGTEAYHARREAELVAPALAREVLRLRREVAMLEQQVRTLTARDA